VPEDVKGSNDKWNAAWLTKDVAVVEGLAADDYVYISPQGQVLDRVAILKIIRSESYRLARGSWTEVSISPLDSDSALVLDRFRGEGEYRGQAFKEDHRRTTVWVRRHQGWQVRLEHCSAITCA
jgi:hypothetical protein